MSSLHTQSHAARVLSAHYITCWIQVKYLPRYSWIRLAVSIHVWPHPHDSPLPVNPLPKRLEPISPVKKKRKRTKKREPDLRTHTSEDELQSGTANSSIGDNLRNQLRSRLDPIYNPTPPSLACDGVEGVGLMTAGSSQREDGHRRDRRKKRARKGTKREKDPSVLSERETSVEQPEVEGGEDVRDEERQRETSVLEEG